MKYIFTALLLLTVFRPDNSWAEKEFRVVVFGDSLSSGYQISKDDAFPAKLQRKIKLLSFPKTTVISISKLAATTASAIQDVDEVNRELPDVVVIMLGINDVIRRVVPSATKSNLDYIIKQLKPTGAFIVLVGVSAPIQNGENYYTESQKNFYELASGNGLYFFPTALSGVEGNPAFTMADGIHPNSLGVDVMVENIFPLVDTGLRWRNDVYNYELELTRIQTPAGVLPAP